MAFEFTDANFQTEAMDTEDLVVLDFWAEWCGPCKMIGPVIEELSEEFQGKAKIGKVNVDKETQVSMKFGIRSIPTILFLKGGEIVDKQVGVTSKENLKSRIENHLS